jgi:hypothetical protein
MNAFVMLGGICFSQGGGVDLYVLHIRTIAALCMNAFVMLGGICFSQGGGVDLYYVLQIS